MQEIRVLGSMLTPEFHGAIGEAEAATPTADASSGPSEISWSFRSTGGARGLYLRYASPGERACKLFVNGSPALKSAAFEPVAEPGDWRYQATVELKPGENRVTLRLWEPAPDIQALVVAAPPAVPMATVDEYRALLDEERTHGGGKLPLRVQPAVLAGLVELVQGVATDDKAFRQLVKVVERAQQTARSDAMDGLTRMSWGGPMNGQRFRQQMLQRLMRLGVDVIVETGTCFGTTTAHFARQGVPVFSCENSERYFGAALAHLVEHRNVTLYFEDSRAFLRELAADPGFTFGFPLFYLDAHWGEDLPLGDEVRIIKQRWPSHAILIDDFQVPGANYGYDRYSKEKALTLDYLLREGVDLEQTAVLFPTLGDEAETGAKRGSVVLVPAAIYEQRLRRDRTFYRRLAGG